MSLCKGTFVLGDMTLRRLQDFSKKTGITQSELVDRLVSSGLDFLEREYQPVETVVKMHYRKSSKYLLKDNR